MRSCLASLDNSDSEKYFSGELTGVISALILLELSSGIAAGCMGEEVIFGMKPGEISEAVPYVQGTYLIVKMIDKKKIKARVELNDEIKGQIYNYLLAAKYQDFLTSYVDSLSGSYKITTDLTPIK